MKSIGLIRHELKSTILETVRTRGYSTKTLASMWAEPEDDVQFNLTSGFQNASLEAMVLYLDRLGIPVWFKAGKPRYELRARKTV